MMPIDEIMTSHHFSGYGEPSVRRTLVDATALVRKPYSYFGWWWFTEWSAVGGDV
jgi:hypothetical protein